MSAESIKLAKDLLAKHASSDFGGLKIVPEYIAQEAVEIAGEIPDCSNTIMVNPVLNGKQYMDGWNNCLFYLESKGIIKLTK